MTSKNPFKVLKLNLETATKEEVKKQYLNLVREFPPEREPHKFREIREAYEKLQQVKSPFDFLSLGPLSLTEANKKNNLEPFLLSKIESRIKENLEGLDHERIFLEIKRELLIHALDNFEIKS